MQRRGCGGGTVNPCITPSDSFPDYLGMMKDGKRAARDGSELKTASAWPYGSRTRRTVGNGGKVTDDDQRTASVSRRRRPDWTDVWPGARVNHVQPEPASPGPACAAPPLGGGKGHADVTRALMAELG